jgi:phosphoribosyl 1,2-cyclic phosphodiesterase
MSVEIAFLGSGSSGNCAVVRSGKTAVLLDAGLSVRETGRRLSSRGMSLGEVSAVLVTHEHTDHVRGALDLAAKWSLPIYATDGTARGARFPGSLFSDVRRVAGGTEISFGGGELTVRVTRTPHDGAESCCYVFADGRGRRAGVVTDLGHLSREVLDALAGCEVLGLEANHDVDLLRAGTYPAFLKRRILSDVGHLSNEDAAAGLYELVGPGTRRVAALHLSQHNNTPALAAGAFRAVLDDLGADIALTVARHDTPTGWLSTTA